LDNLQPKRVDFLQLLMDAHQSELDATDEKQYVSTMDSTVETADEYKKDIGKRGLYGFWLGKNRRKNVFQLYPIWKSSAMH
jgi:hypothetical protein